MELQKEETHTARSLAGTRLGIFGKGGAGKSTLTVMLAEALRRSGYPVLVLDADSTNVGLARALGIDRAPSPLLEHYGGMIFSGGRVTCPVDDPTPLEEAELALADLSPEFVSRNPDGVWLLVAGKLGSLGPGAGCDGPIVKIARDLRVTDVALTGVTLVDYKAGFEDSARGALTSLDLALAVVDPTAAALQLAIHLARMVAAIRAGVPPATRHLPTPELAALAVRLFRETRLRGTGAVLNRVTDTDTERYLRQALEAADVPILGVLEEDPRIQGQWLRGERIRSDRLLRGAAAVVRHLEERYEKTGFGGGVAPRSPEPVPAGTGGS